MEGRRTSKCEMDGKRDKNKNEMRMRVRARMRRQSRGNEKGGRRRKRPSLGSPTMCDFFFPPIFSFH